MKVIGLTGGSGAGKGMVSDTLEDMGIPTIDTDAVYRELVTPGSPCLNELVREFGGGILTKKGELDRKALGNMVFAPGAEQSLGRLNRITHKYILDECSRRISEYGKAGKKAVVVDAPQLFESGFDRICDSVVAVTANRETRIKRIIGRDSLTRAYAEKRIAAQKDDDFFRKNADFVIENNGTLEELAEKVKALVPKLTVRRFRVRRVGRSVGGVGARRRAMRRRR